MTHDNDLIRRNDAALAVLQNFTETTQLEAIAAIPAVATGQPTGPVSNAGSVKVKPLVWETWEHGAAWSDSIFGRYSLWDGHWRGPNDYGGRASENPKAAAQSDYEARILAAIEVQPADPVTNAGAVTVKPLVPAVAKEYSIFPPMAKAHQVAMMLASGGMDPLQKIVRVEDVLSYVARILASIETGSDPRDARLVEVAEHVGQARMLIDTGGAKLSEMVVYHSSVTEQVIKLLDRAISALKGGDA